MHAHAQLVNIPQVWHSKAPAAMLQYMTHIQGHASVLFVLLSTLDSCLQGV